MTPPPRWKMAVLTWIAIYPIITGLLLALGRVILNLPVPVVVSRHNWLFADERVAG